MSSSQPNKDFSKSSKLLESFSCFFEKLAYFSQDSTKNLEKLAYFKKTIYFNMNSRLKVQSLLTTTFKEDYTSLTPLDPKPTTDSSDTITTLKKARSYDAPQIILNEGKKEGLQIPSIPISKEKPTVTIQVPSSNRGLQELNSSMNSSWGLLQTTDDFLVQIKSSIHMDNDEILTFIPSFSLVRSFSQPPESAFYALCFGFFERYVQTKFEEPRITLSQELRTKLDNSLDNDMDTLAKYLDKQFLALIRNFTKRSEKEDIVQRFYEEASSNSSLYSSCLLLFKKILLKVLEKRGLENATRKTSFRWLNEINSADEAFYEEVAALFETNIRFFVLTASKLTEKVFTPPKGPQAAGPLAVKLVKQDLNIFLDRSSGYAYVLYQPKGAANYGNVFVPSPSKKNRQKSHSPGLQKTTNLVGIPTTLPNIMNEDKKSFLVPSDDHIEKGLDSQRGKKSAGVPGPSLVPVANKLYSKTPDSSPMEKPERRYETNPDEKDDWLSSKANLLGLYNQSKVGTTGGYNLKNKENSSNTMLAPKDRESAPMRPGSDYMSFRDTSSLVNKIMDEINQKVKVGKTEEETQERKSGGKMREIQSIPEREGYFFAKPVNKGGEETRKEKNKSFDVNLTREKEFKIVEVPKARQLVLPAQLKTKCNGLNKDIVQHNQEFDDIVMKHVVAGESGVREMKPQLGGMKEIYEVIKRRGNNWEEGQPTIGTTLQMDSKD